jgi:hypothetical protein
MATPQTIPQNCLICHTYVALETSKTDEHGNVVHEECYVRTLKPKVLSGWKDIANYLGKGVRTVQRYERQQHLPVRRISGKTTGSVIATTADLDAWVSGGFTRPNARRNLTTLGRRFNQLKAEFLRIDSEIALTFSAIALISNSSERRNHMALAARKAYNAIMCLRQGVDLSELEKSHLDSNVARLQTDLQRLEHLNNLH